MDDIRGRWPRAQYRDYAVQRLILRGINADEVTQAVFSDRALVIERDEEGFYGPTCLVAGWTDADRPIHLVVGTAGETLWVVTVYDPSVDHRERFTPPDYINRRGAVAELEESDGNLPDL